MDPEQPPVDGINPDDFQMPAGQGNNNNQFGAVRDRLFQAILVKIALGYSRAIPEIGRKVLEYICFIAAIFLLFLLLFVHWVSSKSDSNCLDHLIERWPKDGVIRLEVIENLDMLEYKEEWIRWYDGEGSNMNKCHFNPANVLKFGPKVMPAEVRERKNWAIKGLIICWAAAYAYLPGGGIFKGISRISSDVIFHKKRTDAKRNEYSFFSIFYAGPSNDHFHDLSAPDQNDRSEVRTPFWIPSDQTNPFNKEAQQAFATMFQQRFDISRIPRSLYRMEYSLRYGLLRLPVDYRESKSITTLGVRLDADDACFGDSVTRWTLRTILGYEDSVMVSLRRLAANETIDEAGLGYLHNLDTNEHYHFIRNSMSKVSYISAAIIMVCFTFAISLLLHFSHHQIFVFIVDLLHMFELNQPLQFPAAPLLTVVLALVGMEAIMSEIFADTSTAFYVILIVWIADQFDAICCHSPISKKFWLRFFYLYQFFFYAYQYRFGGQYGGIALLTSIAFIIHSMVYFFHHYEIPLILYREELQRLFALQTARPMIPTPIETIDVVQHAIGSPSSLSVAATDTGSTAQRNSAATSEEDISRPSTAPSASSSENGRSSSEPSSDDFSSSSAEVESLREIHLQLP